MKNLTKEQTEQIANARREGDLQKVADEFASAALVGVLQRINWTSPIDKPTAKQIADDAFAISEAMMVEREKRLRK